MRLILFPEKVFQQRFGLRLFRHVNVIGACEFKSEF